MSVDNLQNNFVEIKLFTNNCPICDKKRTYKTRSGFLRANKNNLPCKSCSNSIQKGGDGKIFKNDKKKCTYCKLYKKLNEFFPKKGGGVYCACKECSKQKAQLYNLQIYRYKKYNISKEDFENLLSFQNGKCAICKNNFKGKIHIDHNHKSLKVRGLLCGLCNKGLGQFRDNIFYLKNAIKYLED